MKDKIIFSINIIRFSSLTAIWTYTGIALYDFYHLPTLLVIIFYSLGFPILVISYILAGHLTDSIGSRNTIIISLFSTSTVLFLGFFLTSGIEGIIILSIQAFLKVIPVLTLKRYYHQCSINRAQTIQIIHFRLTKLLSTLRMC